MAWLRTLRAPLPPPQGSETGPGWPEAPEWRLWDRASATTLYLQGSTAWALTHAPVSPSNQPAFSFFVF